MSARIVVVIFIAVLTANFMMNMPTISVMSRRVNGLVIEKKEISVSFFLLWIKKNVVYQN
jgi:hypothetical protein